MKAKDGVVDFLNRVLQSELTMVHQYLLHAAMCNRTTADPSPCCVMRYRDFLD